MNIDEAKAFVERTLPGAILYRQNSVCMVVKPLADGESVPGGKSTRINNKWHVILGQGLSWRQALRYAAQPVLLEQRAKEQEAMKEAQKDKADFVEFLYNKFFEEFQAWKNPKEEQKNEPPVPASP